MYDDMCDIVGHTLTLLVNLKHGKLNDLPNKLHIGRCKAGGWLVQTTTRQHTYVKYLK